MIVSPTNEKEWAILARFLLDHAGVHPSADLKVLGWVADDKIKIVIGLHSFIGKTAMCHIAMEYDYHFSPRIMLQEGLKYAFDTCQREMLLGVINSDNEESMRHHVRLGLKEIYRIPKVHENDGDMVLVGMRRADCKLLHSRINGKALVAEEA